MEGYIKIHRSMLDWQWYGDMVVTAVFLHLLLTAAFKDGYFKGKPILRGQAVIGRKKLAEMLGLSEQQVRTAIDKLKSSGEITVKAFSKYSVASIVNYDLYQSADETPTSKQPAKLIAPQDIGATCNYLSTSNQPADNHILRKKEDIEDTNVSSCRDTAERGADERTHAKRKRTPKSFEHDSNPYLAAEYMAKRIVRHTPNFPQLREGKREDTLQRWAADIDKLLRLDGVDFEEFKRVLAFSQTDHFWQKNILSGKKLREQYPTLLVRMGGDDGPD